MIRKIDYTLTQKQYLAYKLLTNQDNLSVLFGGAKGGGKSWFFCVWVASWARELAKFFEYKPGRGKPYLAVGFIGRKQGVDFHMTTLETWKKVVPPDWYRIKDKDHEIIFDTGTKIYFGGLDDQERINKFNSAEFAFIAIDQAEETERTDVDVLQGTLRLKYKGKTPPYKQLYTANPADCWLKEDFIDTPQPGHHFIPALYSDNPNLPESYPDTLKSAFKYNKALLAAYLEGDWHALQDENSLVSAKQLNDLKDVHIYPKETRRIVICDPSLGGDECVIYCLENYKKIDELIMHERDTMKIAGQMTVMGERNRTANYGVDIIGIGQGIGDRLRELNPNNRVQFINSALRMDPLISQGVNLRAEMCWTFMQKVLDRKIPYIDDEEIRTQVMAFRFKVVNSNGKVLMLPKDEIKKRIGRSPDRADAFIMGVWALANTEPVRSKDAWRDDDWGREIGTGATSAMTA